MATVQRKPLEELATDWSQIAAKAAPNPFLTLLWHRTLHQLAADCAGLRALTVDGPSAPRTLATLGHARISRSRIFRPRVLLLNETGDSALDRLTVEHNAPLAPAGQEGAALAEMLAGLLQEPDWDEFSTGWVEEQRWAEWSPQIESLPLTPWVMDRRPYFFRDLDPADGDTEHLLAGVSGNTRSQIRRSMRAYGGSAALSAQRATELEQALAWFDEMVGLHQARWQARGKPGAFADPFMRDFHRCLIQAGVEDGYARMLRFEAEGRTIGYLYNLRVRDYECNYQSGLVYEADNKRKPGLVAHTLAMASAAQDGVRRYDFLMGESQYKRSLASGQGAMIRLALQRRRPLLWVERQLRRLRDRLQSNPSQGSST